VVHFEVIGDTNPELEALHQQLHREYQRRFK
jgi:hypothetical protein